MFSILICISLFIIKTSALHFNDAILCRTCGNNIANPNSIVEKISVSTLKTFNETLFSKENVLVQILSKDTIFQFPIIITNHSNCTGLGEWEEEELWFPGFRWRPCLCPECGVLIGWSYEKIYLESKELDTFYALILPNLVSKRLLDSIIIGPLQG